MLRRTDTKQTLLYKRVAACVEDFAPLPSVAMRVMEMVSDPDTMAADLETVLRGDVSLVAAVLKLSNSAFYGLRRQVVSLKHALSLLGKSEVQNLILARVLFQTFKLTNSHQRTLVTGIWRHSLECGLAAECIAEQGHEESQLFFLGGMLHDLGKLLVVNEFSEEIEGIAHYGQLTGAEDLEIELGTLGCGHDELGAQLLYRWMFPPSLVQMVGEHHNYEKLADCAHSSQLLILADLLSRFVALKDWENEMERGETESGRLESLLLRYGGVSGIIVDGQGLERVEGEYRKRLGERADLLDLLLAG
ncbi:MAG: HDOD domain-containing protein [Proteobacteria bacterium]|nr:HDOD domain-containing protein [Pseudomonadota bacterium]MBU1059766.1 HDOD domain-containing protein [Pseudomonadota bacterium]